MSEDFTLQEAMQQVLADAVTQDEEIAHGYPEALPVITWQQKNDLAGKLWLAAGGLPDDPNTLDHWLQAEVTLEADTPPAPNLGTA